MNGKDVDVVTTDTIGTKSQRADGFDLFLVPQKNDRRAVVLGIHPDTGVVQHWIFDLDRDGKGTVIWGTIRGGTIFPKSNLMKAECFGP